MSEMNGTLDGQPRQVTPEELRQAARDMDSSREAAVDRYHTAFRDDLCHCIKGRLHAAAATIEALQAEIARLTEALAREKLTHQFWAVFYERVHGMFQEAASAWESGPPETPDEWPPMLMPGGILPMVSDEIARLNAALAEAEAARVPEGAAVLTEASVAPWFRRLEGRSFTNAEIACAQGAMQDQGVPTSWVCTTDVEASEARHLEAIAAARAAAEEVRDDDA